MWMQAGQLAAHQGANKHSNNTKQCMCVSTYMYSHMESQGAKAQRGMWNQQRWFVLKRSGKKRTRSMMATNVVLKWPRCITSVGVMLMGRRNHSL